MSQEPKESKRQSMAMKAFLDLVERVADLEGQGPPFVMPEKEGTPGEVSKERSVPKTAQIQKSIFEDDSEGFFGIGHANELPRKKKS